MSQSPENPSNSFLSRHFIGWVPFLVLLFSGFVLEGIPVRANLSEEYKQRDQRKATCIAAFEGAKYQASNPIFRFNIVNSRLIRYANDDYGNCISSYESEKDARPPINPVVIGKIYAVRYDNSPIKVQYLLENGVINRYQKSGVYVLKREIAWLRRVTR